MEASRLLDRLPLRRVAKKRQYMARMVRCIPLHEFSSIAENGDRGLTKKMIKGGE
jgi:hypothetical protein